MAVQGGEDIYATLLLTDSYLPGALVLAHSLRDAGTTKKLAVLVTLDTVSAEVVTQLKAIFNYVIPVSRVRNENPANLYLMDRPDLHSAFTKINIWRQTQFRKIVYIDADVVAYRAPDELFDLPYAFSAAPDIGWPDLFNTGVMVLTPNMGDYYALMAMAQRGISFDGADQGLLNQYFKNYNRLSFTYNVTPSAHYQYIPAYRHFQSSINMVHFIGANKPWLQGRDARTGSGPYNEMFGRWWAVYDKHYRKTTPPPTPTSAPKQSIQPTQPAQPAPELVQYFVKGEYQPKISYVIPVGEPAREQASGVHGQHYQPSVQPSLHSEHHFQQPHDHHEQHPPVHQQYHQEPEHHRHHEPQAFYQHDPQHSRHEHHHEPSPHHHHHHHDQPHYHSHEQSQPGSFVQHSEQHHPLPSESFRSVEGSHTEAREEQVSGHQQWAPHTPQTQPQHKQKPPQPPPMQSWDAQRQPPPPDSRPEAINFPQTHYEMSSDPAPFVPPERYPSPPRNMWYDVPKEPPAPPTSKPRPIFPWEMHRPRPSRVFANDSFPPEETGMGMSTTEPSGEHMASTDSRVQAEPSFTEASTVEPKSEPETPITPTLPMAASDPWSSFTRVNAWDEVPGIERYVDAIQKHRRTRSQGLRIVGLPPSGITQEEVWQSRGSKLTDFPSEVERPSLPVTPAPIRRQRFWGGGGPALGLGGDDDDDQLLPAAEGVPPQSDWDPVVQLQKLAKAQSELLLQKLGGSGGSVSGGGDGASAQGIEGREIPNRPLPFGSEGAKSPTYVAQSPTVLSPKPVKPGSGTNSVRNLLQTESEAIPRTVSEVSSGIIPGPSYLGPGLAFEKGEDIPTHETPALPTEEGKRCS